MLRDNRPRPPKPIRQMPNNPKPTLEMARLPIFRVHYLALEAYINRMKNSPYKPPTPVDYQAEAKRRTDAAAKAQQLADTAGK